jgi:hypothetical protein
MFEDMDFDFKSDEEIRTRPPAGTIAKVRVRPSKDGVLGDFKSGRSEYGPWMIVNFEVVGGDFHGEWASTILNLKPDDRRFRATFQAITGVDISGGGNVSFADFKDRLISGVFEAEIGPEKRKVKSADDQQYLKAVENGAAKDGLNVGDLYETGFTSVQKILSRVGERDEYSAGDQPTPSITQTPAAAEAPAADIAEEDVPF